MIEKFGEKIEAEIQEKKPEKKIGHEQSEELPEEIENLLESKAEYVYENNIVVRFTNAAYLDDIFVTKKEFKGDVMLMMQDDQDYSKYYSDRSKKYSYLPQGLTTLGVLVDKVYREEGIDPKQESGRIKSWVWSDFIHDRTDWIGSGGGRYRTRELDNIEEIKRQSSDRANFASRMRQHVIERFNLSPEKPPKNEVLREILENEDYFQKPSKVREYLHDISGMYFEKAEKDKELLKSGRDIMRHYNIGMLVSIEATENYGRFGRKSWGKFKNVEEIDISKDLKGLICTIRDRVFEQKVIEEMEKLTKQNPEARVPVFDLDGNQIYPVRRKREEIEETIKQRQEELGEK